MVSRESCREQQELGRRVRAAARQRAAIPSVAAEGFKAPGVDRQLHLLTRKSSHGKKFVAAGFQTAAGVPLQCDEPAEFRTFRIGLFGLEKLHNPERTVENLAKALDAVA